MSLDCEVHALPVHMHLLPICTIAYRVKLMIDGTSVLLIISVHTNYLQMALTNMLQQAYIPLPVVPCCCAPCRLWGLHTAVLEFSLTAAE